MCVAFRMRACAERSREQRRAVESRSEQRTSTSGTAHRGCPRSKWDRGSEGASPPPHQLRARSTSPGESRLGITAKLLRVARTVVDVTRGRTNSRGAGTPTPSSQSVPNVAEHVETRGGFAPKKRFARTTAHTPPKRPIAHARRRERTRHSECCPTCPACPPHAPRMPVAVPLPPTATWRRARGARRSRRARPPHRGAPVPRARGSFACHSPHRPRFGHA